MDIWWRSIKGSKFKSGGTICIRICEYNFENQIWGHFFKKGVKIKRI